MGAKVRTSNLDAYNAKRSEHGVFLLEDELRLCTKHKLSFKTAGLLASYVSGRIKIHRTTLTRNPTYKGMLLAHFARQPGIVARTPDSTTDSAVLQAKLAVSKLETSNARSALSRASAQTDHQLKKVRDELVPPIEAASYGHLAMVVVLLLHRFPEFLQLDVERFELQDISAKPSERLIAGKDRLKSFVRWLEMNRANPMVKNLLDAAA